MNQQKEFSRILPQSFFSRIDQVFHSPFAGPVFIDLTYLTDSLGEEKELSPIIDWLGKPEIEKFTSFKFKKRYIEWLGGRLCAKKAFTEYIQKFHSLQIIPPPHDLIVASQQNGRPFLQCDQLAKTTIQPDLSISHGSKYAMAMVSKTWCGIDIQEKQQSLVKVKEKFCSKTEENLLTSILHTDAHPPLHFLTLLWAAKEALRKMLSNLKLIGFLETALDHIQIIDDNTSIFRMRLPESLLQTEHINVLTLFHSTFGIALCQLPEKESLSLEGHLENNA